MNTIAAITPARSPPLTVTPVLEAPLGAEAGLLVLPAPPAVAVLDPTIGGKLSLRVAAGAGPEAWPAGEGSEPRFEESAAKPIEGGVNR